MAISGVSSSGSLQHVTQTHASTSAVTEVIICGAVTLESYLLHDYCNFDLNQSVVVVVVVLELVVPLSVAVMTTRLGC